MPKSQGVYWKILIWMAAAVILFSVSIQADNAPAIVIQKGHWGGFDSVVISRDKKYLVTGSRDHIVGLWDASTGKEIRTFAGHTGWVRSVALSGDGQTLVSGSDDHTVRLWDVRTGKEIRILVGHTLMVRSVTLSGDGQTLVSGSNDNTVRLWDVRTGKEIRNFTMDTGGVSSVALSGDGQVLAFGSNDHTVRLLDIRTGKEIRTFAGHTWAVTSVALSGDGQTLASGSGDKTVRLWDVKTGKEICIFSGHTDWVHSVALSVDGQTLVSGSNDNTVRLWDVRTGKEIRTLAGHTYSVNSVALSMDGQTLISGSLDNTVRLWDVRTGKEIRIVTRHTAWVNSVALSMDGQTLISGSLDKTVRLWEVRTGKEICIFPGHTGWVTSVALSGDGQTLASGSNDNIVRLWDVRTGKEIRTFTGHTNWVTSVTLSEDGQTLASGDRDHTVRLWDARTGKEIRTFAGTNWVTSVALSGDGKILTSSEGLHETVHLWEVSTGEEICIFAGHMGWVDSVALSGDGQSLVSGNNDHTVRLWDVRTGKEIRTFAGHTSMVNSVALSTNSTYIVSGSYDCEIKIWDLQKGSLLVSLIAFEDNEWVAYTPDNYYICSPEGEKYVTFRVDNTIYDAPKYSKLYNNAGVVSNRLNINNAQKISTGKPIPVDTQPIDISKKPSTESAVTEHPATTSQPLVVINYFKCKGSVIEEENPEVDVPEVEINATLKENEYDLKKIIITVNDITYWEKNLSGKTYKLKQTVTLCDSSNRIKIIATNSRGRQGVEEKVITYHKTTAKGDNSLRDLVKSVFGKKRSWAVLIGIKDYSLQRNGLEPLPYALNDVQAVKDYLITGMDFDEDNIKTLVDSRATREEIIKELGENIPARVGTNDRVLIYFSCHGGKEVRKTDKEILSYLIPYDGKQKSLYSTGIPIDVISDLSKRIPAKHVLFIVDACFSGNIGQITKSGGYPEETKKEIETFIENKSREMITAGTKDEVANMGYEWNQQSVYTFHLLKGLRGGADYNGNKVITLTELQLYLESVVPKELKVKQTPQRIPLESREGGQFVFYREGED